MTLISMILAMAYGGLSAGIRSSHSGEMAIERTNRLRVAHEFVRRQLTRTLPLVMIQEDGQDPEIFVGERDYMAFVAPMPGYLSHGGPHIQELFIEAGDSGRELLFDHHLLHAEADVDDYDEREPVLLMGEIEDAWFEYRGLDDEGELGDWQDGWDEVSRVPLMIRVNVEMKEESRLVWPTLVAVPVIDATSGRSLLRSPLIPGGGRTQGQQQRDNQ